MREGPVHGREKTKKDDKSSYNPSEGESGRRVEDVTDLARKSIVGTNEGVEEVKNELKGKTWSE